MRTIDLNVSETALGGPGALAEGVAEFEYVTAAGAFSEVVGSDVTMARKITVQIVDGAPVSPILLAPTRGVCCVRATIRSHITGDQLPTRYVEIPIGEGPVAYGELVDVDPTTYTPAEATPTLMDTILATLRGEFDATVFRIDGGDAATIHPEETP